jgi:hypothetical protein
MLNFQPCQNKNKILFGICHQFFYLLQVSGDQLLENGAPGNSSIGTFLGWAMTFVYLSGRMPQIFLNVSIYLTLLTADKNYVTLDKIVYC